MHLKQTLKHPAAQTLLFLGVLAVIAVDLGELDYKAGSYFWFRFHEVFYLAAVFAALVSLRATSVAAPATLGLALGYLASATGAFDDRLHPFLVERLYGSSGFVTNPQFTKLVFYGIGFGALIAKLLHPSRRLLHLLCLVLLAVNMALALNNHKSFPDGMLRELIDLRRTELMQATDLRPQELGAFCRTHQAVCRYRTGSSVTEVPSAIAMTPYMRDYYQVMRKQFDQGFEANVLNTFTANSLYISYTVAPDYAIEVFDPVVVDRYWSMSVFYFYRNSSFVSCGWFLFFVVLGVVHRKVNRRYDLRNIFK